MVLALCTSPDDALYLYNWESISTDFRVTDLNSRVNIREVANVDAGWTEKRHAQTDTHRQTENWLSTYPLMMLHICIKFCESISKDLE